MINTKGQIWIETVIYTIIGLSLMAVVLAIVTPKINEMRDRAIIEQTIESLNVIDSKIGETLAAPGNTRIVEFKMKRGNLYFYGTEDKIEYVLEDSRTLFSEPGVTIAVGRVNVTTTEGVKTHVVNLSMSYSQNMTFDGQEEVAHLTMASVPYRFAIENRGFPAGSTKLNVDIGTL